MDDEIVVLAIAKQFHFTLHAYPELGYVAVDLFAFNRTLPLTQFMKSLRQSFGSEKVKATTVPTWRFWERTRYETASQNQNYNTRSRIPYTYPINKLGANSKNKALRLSNH